MLTQCVTFGAPAAVRSRRWSQIYIYIYIYIPRLQAKMDGSVFWNVHSTTQNKKTLKKEHGQGHVVEKRGNTTRSARDNTHRVRHVTSHTCASHSTRMKVSIARTNALCHTQPRSFRLAGKKFGHPAGMQKINSEKVRRNKSKTAKIVIDKMGNREIAVEWKLVVWASRACFYRCQRQIWRCQRLLPPAAAPFAHLRGGDMKDPSSIPSQSERWVLSHTQYGTYLNGSDMSVGWLRLVGSLKL